MKIIALVSIHTKSGLVQPGGELDLPPREARDYIDQELAIPAAKSAPPPGDNGDGR